VPRRKKKKEKKKEKHKKRHRVFAFLGQSSFSPFRHPARRPAPETSARRRRRFVARTVSLRCPGMLAIWREPG
jgi:hypothetical protein